MEAGEGRLRKRLFKRNGKQLIRRNSLFNPTTLKSKNAKRPTSCESNIKIEYPHEIVQENQKKEFGLSMLHKTPSNTLAISKVNCPTHLKNQLSQICGCISVLTKLEGNSCFLK